MNSTTQSWEATFRTHARTHTHTHTPVLSCLSTAEKRSRGPPYMEEAKKESSASAAVSCYTGLHLCTARPPLLQNHFWHFLHFTALLCSSIGFALSIKHLCLFLSLGLLNFLPHSVHITQLYSVKAVVPAELVAFSGMFSGLFSGLDSLQAGVLCLNWSCCVD